MALNYDEAIAELRAEANRLEREAEQVRAAIQGLIIVRNRARSSSLAPAPAPPPPLPLQPTKPGRLSGMGPTKAIFETLNAASLTGVAPMTSRQIYDAMTAEGWSTTAQKPVGVIAATLIQLEKNGVAERVGEAWRLKNRLDSAFATAISQAEAIASGRPS
jgi:hypothetical protein